MKSFYLAALFCASISAEFNFTKCPAPWEVQSDAMKADFSLSKFYGKYYELWYHDWTQNVLCPKPSCVNTNKTYEAATNQVVGNWHLECFGYSSPLQHWALMLSATFAAKITQ